MVTTELRYFFDNNLTGRSMAFIEKYQMDGPGSRTDYYLKNRLSTTCGVKWREGNLEVKSLVQKLTYLDFKLEMWEKNTLLSQIKQIGDSDWLAVNKKRWLFYFDEQRSISTDMPEEGQLYGQVELSELQLKDKKFHSFCLECGGGRVEEQPPFLFKCLQTLESDTPGFRKQLLSNTPCSYPVFILPYSSCT